VVQIDGISVGQGQIGPVTRDLMARFERHHGAYLDSLGPRSSAGERCTPASIGDEAHT
jgi:hypothetical protein